MPDSIPQRLCLTLQGIVQGVGCRPFIYRLATDLKLTGWVHNSAAGVEIEIEGQPECLQAFLDRLPLEKPPHARIEHLQVSDHDPVGYQHFEIRSSQTGSKQVLIAPDLATCPACLHEIFDPADRRYRYPFTNCTHCGPRFSIIRDLPYDRPYTSMRSFPMCEACHQEYQDPLNRRFHAQPNACPVCGPHVQLWDRSGAVLATHDAALLKTAAAIRQGQIVALKGLGGFHLVVDARQETVVQRLRDLKRRPSKPFAIMVPSLDHIRSYCFLSDREADQLTSSAAPIVLLRRRSIRDPGDLRDLEIPEEAQEPKGLQDPITPGDPNTPIAAAVAPENPYLGIMLPYTPLHHLLLHELQFPIVATSGNLSDEPICTDEYEALDRLGEIADCFLIHNRPIIRPVDDSIVQVVLEKPMILRRARGYAPLSITDFPDLPPGILSVGAYLKNTVALSLPGSILISQHLGDLDTPATRNLFEHVIRDLSSLYDQSITTVACDAHPDAYSTQFAERLKLPRISVQHHYAHVLSGMVDNGLLDRNGAGRALGVAWDGTGYGLDQTIWGGEFLQITDTGFERVAYLRPFPLPGGNNAIREPRRIALGLLYAGFGDRLWAQQDRFPLQAFQEQELRILQRMVSRDLNCPRTSSVGRLFDAVASILGVKQYTEFEGQAAMALEFASDLRITVDPYPFELVSPEADRQQPQGSNSLAIPHSISKAAFVIDWFPMLQELLKDLDHNVAISKISTRFHQTLAKMIVRVAEEVGDRQVVLTGGCFQNRILLTYAVDHLQQASFSPYWHHQIPPNDGGIAVGQMIAAQREC